jgi:hypothetical protein
MDASIKLGSRIYLRNAICGEPGCVVGWDKKGYAEVFWPDLYSDMKRHTFHHPDTLIIDEAFTIRQLDLFEIAA